MSETFLLSALQERCAKMFGKEAALLVPTGTMGNLISSKFAIRKLALEIY